MLAQVRVVDTRAVAGRGRIKALENELGILLFKRIGKSVQLTEAGAKMLTYADKLLAIREEALASSLSA